MASQQREQSAGREGAYLLLVGLSVCAAIVGLLISLWSRGVPANEGIKGGVILAALATFAGVVTGVISLFACYSRWTFFFSVAAIGLNAVVFEVFTG
ncbi:MAG: hypothetical protein WD768_22175 [Phycisphaeraceae bacterium]